MEPLSSKDPKSIGDYTLIGRLGSGGMGIVYLAANGPDSVALKVIKESLLQDPSQATRFSREIETLKKINSPYVAKIINSGVTDGKAWYATEFVNGPDLKSLVDAKGPLKGDAWMNLAEGLLQGISAIHAQGIIHRDIKPANVIVAELGPKIIDFGIAQVSDATSVTSTGLVAGTPAWFSPEQIEGKSLTVATDLFSAGSVLAYAATGRSPWGEENTMTKASVYGILVSKPDLTGASSDQVRIISRLLEKEPSKRHFPSEPAGVENSDSRFRWPLLPKPQVVQRRTGVAIFALFAALLVLTPMLLLFTSTETTESNTSSGTIEGDFNALEGAISDLTTSGLSEAKITASSSTSMTSLKIIPPSSTEYRYFKIEAPVRCDSEYFQRFGSIYGLSCARIPDGINLSILGFRGGAPDRFEFHLDEGEYSHP